MHGCLIADILLCADSTILLPRRILFGPLALVNTAVGITFGFTDLNLGGTDSCWRITYRFGEVFEDLGDGVSTVFPQHSN
jgi:hypothetical protein